eukprot:3560339-Amphidinium_carterae.1
MAASDMYTSAPVDTHTEVPPGMTPLRTRKGFDLRLHTGPAECPACTAIIQPSQSSCRPPVSNRCTSMMSELKLL